MSTTTAPTASLVVKLQNEITAMSSDFAMMLPEGVTPDKFVRTIKTAITMNPEIAEADKKSVINACMKAASDGLILDGREAYMRIGKSKQKDGTYKKIATYIPMVAGIQKRVRQSDEISRFNAFVRYENDKFKRTLGLDMTLEHEPNDDTPGKPLGAYAMCKFKDGEVDYEYMSAKQILDLGATTSNAAQYQVTSAHYGEWWKKTVMRRLSKRLPMSSERASAAITRIDEDYDDSIIIPHDDEQPTQEAPRRGRKSAAQKMAEVTPEPEAQQEATVIEHDEETGEITNEGNII